jgi:hypothetical protein
MASKLSSVDPRTRRGIELAALALLLAGLVLALVALAGGPVDIIKNAIGPGKDNLQQLGKFIDVVNSVKDDALWALGSVSVMGLLGGGIMMAAGNPRGGSTMGFAAGAMLATLAGYGIIA